MSRQSPDCPRRKTCYNKRTNKEGDGDGKQEIRQALDPRTFEKPGMDQELMAQLLPRPQYRRFNGRSVPIGTGTMSGPQRPPRPFRPNPGGPARADLRPPRLRQRPPLLGRAWQGTPPREKQRGCWPDIITRPLVSPPPAAARGQGLRSNQISGFLNQFLSWEPAAMRPSSPGVLTHFVQAGVWLGDHPDAPLAGLVKSPVSRGSPGRRGTGHRQLHRRQPEPICRRCCR